MKGVLWLVAVIALVIVLSQALGLAKYSATRLGYVGGDWGNSWWGRYVRLDGTAAKSFQADGEIQASIQTDEGSLSLIVTDSDGEEIFRRENIETSQFVISAQGRVTMRLEAQAHAGSFSFSCE